MVRVIEFPNEKKIKCSCGVTLAYNPSTDLKTEQHNNHLYTYLLCPVCKKKIMFA